MEDLLVAVESFAARAHGAQRRKYSDEPYIAHPMRVMKMCRDYSNSVPLLAAALLHDVLEDTNVKAHQLEVFLNGVMAGDDVLQTMTLVRELTDVYTNKAFPKLNRRTRKHREARRIASTSSEAQTIKYADIIDNTNDIVTADPDFARVFLRECRALLRQISNGQPELYRRALDTVSNALTRL